MKDGIVDLLKPPGMTSHDCVYALRRAFGVKRIGHTGTLDPNAAGVLPLCVGKAARLIEYMEKDRKSYLCELRLGLATDTLDVWGKPLIEARPFPVLREDEAKALLQGLVGPQLQLPPAYSAVKVQGRKLYEYARKGQQVEVKPRPVEVYDARLARLWPEEGRMLFHVSCSAGTYVRSLVSDLGEALGCGAAMSFLLRTASGAFRLENTVTLEALAADPAAHLLPLDFALGHLGRLELKEERVPWYLHGGSLAARDLLEEAPAEGAVFRVYGRGRFLGTAKRSPEDELYLADKVIYEDPDIAS